MQTVYDRDGFEVVRGVIPVGDLEPLRDRISDQVGLHAKQLLDETNGCLYVIPGSHEWEQFCH